MAQNTSDQPVYDGEFYWRRGFARHGDPNTEPIGTMLPNVHYKSERAFPPNTNMAVSGAILRFTTPPGSDGYAAQTAISANSPRK